MENKNIMVGRHQELALLQEIISSPKAELVAVYGRRRIGKTFLSINSLICTHCSTFAS